MCSKKWAVPLLYLFSNLDPASIQTPTVAVLKFGFDSVAIVKPLSSLVMMVSGIFAREAGYDDVTVLVDGLGDVIVPKDRNLLSCN